MPPDAGAAAPIATAELADALLTGIHRVVASQETLNRINVFPVADGDTGTNLALTLLSARPALTRHRDDGTGALLERVADALLDGARGNSGAIVAQFFQGLADALRDRSVVTLDAFTSALANASDYARDALAEPREGTILSVIRVMADASNKALRGACDLQSLLAPALAATQTALEKTPEQLAELRRAGVVDAGAQGFVHFVEGMLAYARERTVPDFDALAVADEYLATDAAGAETDLDYRYCTECIVTGHGIDRRKLRESLAELGGSLVLAGTHAKAKIHIHVNDPALVFETAGRFGAVSGEKADDMHRQQATTHGKAGTVAIITDSSADLSDALLEELDIHIVPIRIQFGDKGFLDKLSISPEQFYEELATNPIHPKTSQPAPGDFRRQLQFLASHFETVFLFSISDMVSGTYNAAVAAAGRVTGGERIAVVNTKNASVGQGLIVRRAAELAHAGADARSIRAAIDTAVSQTRSFCLLADLGASVKGGRIPAWAKFVADVLRLNPVLGTTPAGEIKPVSALIGRSGRIAKFARFIARRAHSGQRYRLAVSHAQCEDDANALAARLREMIELDGEADICPTGAAFGVHGGPGTLVAALQPCGER